MKNKLVILGLAVLLSFLPIQNSDSTEQSLRDVTLDNPLPAPKDVVNNRHEVCDAHGICTFKTDLSVLCQNGMRMHTILVQPIGGFGQVEHISFNRTAAPPRVLQQLNDRLRKKPRKSRIEVVGYCGSANGSFIYTAYTFENPRPSSGPDLVVFRNGNGGSFVINDARYQGGK